MSLLSRRLSLIAIASLSVSSLMYANTETPIPPTGYPSGGLFMTYWNNLVDASVCPAGQAITDFSDQDTTFSRPLCEIIASQLLGEGMTGTLNYLTKYTPDGEHIGVSAVYESGGKVGIGKNDPEYSLDTIGDASINGVRVGRGEGDMPQNTAVGSGALSSNTTGNFNVANGTLSLQSNTTGQSNTANGRLSLALNTTGNANTANGETSLYRNITGFGNTANGKSSLYGNTSGAYNVASGLNALYSNTTGFGNTANGNDALYYNTTGNSNISIGYRAGYNLISGDNNIFIGSNTAPNISTTASNQLNIGNWIYGNTGRIGIGTKTPQGMLHIAFSNDPIDGTNGRGLIVENTGAGNTGLFQKVSSPTAGNGLQFCYDPDPNQYNFGECDSRAGFGYSHGGKYFDFWTSTGGSEWSAKVFIDIYGKITATAYLYSSDARLKKDITPLTDALTKIRSLSGYTFTWKSSDQADIGVIAQEVEKVFPEIVHTASGSAEGYKSVEYGNLVAPLIESVKSLADTNDSQDEKIEKLLEVVDAQQKEIDALKAEVEALQK